MRIIDPKTCCQVSIVARDIEKTAKIYAELFGVEMPEIFMIPPVEMAQTKFRGAASNTQARLCVFDMGQVCLEIMEPDEYDSSWKEALGDKDVVFHHIGFKVEDLDKTLDYFAEKGCPERHRGNYPGGIYVLPETMKPYGMLFNLKYESAGSNG
jgi:methylmalonyl-CoA/ethylmalonyl-CoA epimerase